MPLLWLSLGFLGGLILVSAQPLSWQGWAAIAAGLVLLSFFEGRMLGRWRIYSAWRGLARVPLGIVLAAVALGGLRYAAAQRALTESDLAWYAGKGSYHLTGIVQQPPQRSGTSLVLVVAAEQIAPLEPAGPSRPIGGLLRVRLPSSENWRYGDMLELDGALLDPQEEESPSYAAYLERGGIAAEMEYPHAARLERDAGSPWLALLYDLQAVVQRTIAALLPQPESGLLAGILLGDDSRLPEKVNQAFRDSGVAHIIAVSGFNIAILSAMFVQGLGRLMRARFAVPLAILAIAGYTLLTGGSPSVVRAAVMGGVTAVGPLFGRRGVGVNSLAFTAALMALFDPHILWSVSFQLSFAATLGLVLYGEPLQGGFTRLLERRLSAPLARKLAGPVGEYLLLTLAAQFFTLPITVISFQRVSLSAVLANPLILPAQPLAMILGGIAALVGMAFLPLGQLLAWLCWPLLAYTIRVSEALARIPQGVWVTGEMGMGLAVLYYAALLALALAAVRRWLARVWKPSASLVAAGLLAGVLWQAALAAPDGRLHLDLLNLEGGPAVLLRSPRGQTWLVGGGSDARALADAVGRRLPLFFNRLDGLAVPEGKAAVLQSLTSLVQRYPPGLLAFHNQIRSSTAGNRLLAQLYETGTRRALLEPGLGFDLGADCTLRVLTVTDQGAVLEVVWGSFRTLFPGRVPISSLDAAQREELAGLNLLLLPGGASDAEIETWNYALRPALLAVGARSAPPPAGALDLGGYAWFSLVTDGEKAWVEAQKR